MQFHLHLIISQTSFISLLLITTDAVWLIFCSSVIVTDFQCTCSKRFISLVGNDLAEIILCYSTHKYTCKCMCIFNAKLQINIQEQLFLYCSLAKPNWCSPRIVLLLKQASKQHMVTRKCSFNHQKACVRIIPLNFFNN